MTIESSEDPRPVVHQNRDESIEEMLEAHKAAIKEQGGKPRKSPTDFQEALSSFEEFCATVLD